MISESNKRNETLQTVWRLNIGFTLGRHRYLTSAIINSPKRLLKTLTKMANWQDKIKAVLSKKNPSPFLYITLPFIRVNDRRCQVSMTSKGKNQYK